MGTYNERPTMLETRCMECVFCAHGHTSLVVRVQSCTQLVPLWCLHLLGGMLLSPEGVFAISITVL